jgi:hypothetical protein
MLKPKNWMDAMNDAATIRAARTGKNRIAADAAVRAVSGAAAQSASGASSAAAYAPFTATNCNEDGEDDPVYVQIKNEIIQMILNEVEKKETCSVTTPYATTSFGS